MSKIDYFICQC